MAWRLIHVPDEQASVEDLTNTELIGVSVILTHTAGEPYSDKNVYWRAREKIQPQVRAALDNEDN